jgi:hypothetical protein
MTLTFADQKDVQRARDLGSILSRNGYDKAIGAATKMAKLIKDIDKLLRRTEAVVSEDLRLVEPFIDRCREYSNYSLRELVTAYDTGKTVGRYSPGVPKPYSTRSALQQEIFMAGFASTYGYNNLIGSRDYGI